MKPVDPSVESLSWEEVIHRPLPEMTQAPAPVGSGYLTTADLQQAKARELARPLP